MNDIKLFDVNNAALKSELHSAVRLTAQPTSLFLVLTKRCNIDCVMCCQKEEKHQKDLPYAVVEKIWPLLPYLREITWQGSAPLKMIFRDRENIIYIDNDSIFKNAVKNRGYKQYFKDDYGGDFGHCKPEGNILIAENVADAIVKYIN